MTIFLTILIAIISVLLVLIVMIQNPKGGGLSSGFSSANQIGGVRKTADFLDKATWALAIGLVVLSFASSALSTKKVTGTIDQELTKKAQQLQQEKALQNNTGNILDQAQPSGGDNQENAEEPALDLDLEDEGEEVEQND